MKNTYDYKTLIYLHYSAKNSMIEETCHKQHVCHKMIGET